MEVIIGRKKTPVLVDEEDYVRLKDDWCFSISSHGYLRAIKYIGVENGKYKYNHTYFHKLVIKQRKGMFVDHINGNKLDNRKENLRICTPASSSRNTCSSKGYKGVFQNKRNGRWTAQITKNYKCFHLGMYSTAEEAALAYNKAAKKMHGKYAYKNIVKNCQ